MPAEAEAEAVLPTFAELQRDLPLKSPRAWRFGALALASRAGALVSDGLRVGYAHGFDSGPFMAHVYANRPAGRTALGRRVDGRLLSRRTCVAFREIRELARQAVLDAIDAHGGEAPVIADLAAGPAPYLLEAIASRPGRTAVVCDIDPAALAQAEAAARRLGVRGPGPYAARRRLRPRRASCPRAAAGRGDRARAVRDLPRRRASSSATSRISPSSSPRSRSCSTSRRRTPRSSTSPASGATIAASAVSGACGPPSGCSAGRRPRATPPERWPRTARGSTAWPAWSAHDERAHLDPGAGARERARLGAHAAAEREPPRHVELPHLPRRDRAARPRPGRALSGRDHEARSRHLGRPRLAHLLLRAAAGRGRGHARGGQRGGAQPVHARPRRAASRRRGRAAGLRARRLVRGGRHRGRPGRAGAGAAGVDRSRATR